MNLFNRWMCAAVLCGVAGVVNACGDAHKADVKARAHAWVDRLHDTTKAAIPDSVAADTSLADSLGAAFTTDDWLYFWYEVEQEQVRRGKGK